jgi:glycosyltransferase involved in cell wall biosynthesis
MRIALDLQPCQTESRWRGIGRYTDDFTRALLKRKAEHEFILGLDATYTESAVLLKERHAADIPDEAFRPYHYPTPRLPVTGHGDSLRTAAEAIVRHAYAQVSADVVHVNSLFEGFIEHAVGLGQLANMPGAISSVTLYDVIPLMLPHWYLQDAAYRAWYHLKLRELARFDLVFCISEATRRDAIERIGLPGERMVVIGAGVSEHLLSGSGQPGRDTTLARFGIGERYVLYTGNADPRKNLAGAIQAFAAVPAEQRRGVQLVLNQVGDEVAVRTIASRAGLEHDDLAVTGRVTDAELETLLRHCEVFFFPSLYEGFGLPVLEAMACGAPTICADNSSLPEVMGRADALFDASSLASASGKLAQALSDAGFREALRSYGTERARGFTWDAVAQRAQNAWDAAHAAYSGLGLLAHRQKRLKVAMVTPMRPARTGIADYVDALLPALASRFDLDLYVNLAPTEIHSTDRDDTAKALVQHAHLFAEDRCVIRPWTEFPSRAEEYDQVVYQMGNSPFHAHMLELMDRFPGVVVLHDLYLSSLLGYIDQNAGHAGLFAAALDHSHGRGAVALLAHEGGPQAAIQRFPASRKILDCADAIIMHSFHSIQLATSFYEGVARGPLVYAPMPQVARQAGEVARAEARNALGVPEGNTLIVSFGFVADTKCAIELLDALRLNDLGKRSDLSLVFVGELDGGEYGQRVRDLIDSHPLASSISITGFVEDEHYAEYLVAADIAIQLRAKSRGETSKSVLDCLAHGIATIVNNYGSLGDIPDDCVLKVARNADPEEIAESLVHLVSSPARRSALGEAGRLHVVSEHAPVLTAQKYEEAIRSSLWARYEREGLGLRDRLVAAASMPDADERAVEEIGSALKRNLCCGRTRLFVDMSDIVQNDHNSGIQRVVRNLVRELLLSETSDSRCVPVALNGEGALHPLNDQLGRILSIPVLDHDMDYAPSFGDRLFLVDSSWANPQRFRPAIDAMRQAGGQVFAMVYDLIPQRFPQYCLDFMPPVHKTWLRFVIAECDGLICISRSVAEDLVSWIAENDVPQRDGLRIGCVPLGSDLVERTSADPSAVSGEIRTAMGAAGSAHLMVGTLEPRKRHELVLDAFELAWSRGWDGRLVILGKEGWNVEALAARIKAHPEAGRRLFWFNSASDDELNYAYARAARTVQASAAEGFGLPLVEAARHGCSVLASDIPVFREVAGDSAAYFPPDDVAALADALQQPPRGKANATMHTWAESARATRDRLRGIGWTFVLDGRPRE